MKSTCKLDTFDISLRFKDRSRDTEDIKALKCSFTCYYRSSQRNSLPTLFKCFFSSQRQETYKVSFLFNECLFPGTRSLSFALA